MTSLHHFLAVSTSERVTCKLLFVLSFHILKMGIDNINLIRVVGEY